ncbi:lipopolysaccharide kinase InaA family protein [Alkalilimnicola ehrlichii]|uniref:lipopolysaccharide kinase InaA family protein n=1 Tax=Alkalilimnicola ehrlichii TaxID=351052 RepID=UPI003B9FF253
MRDKIMQWLGFKPRRLRENIEADCDLSRVARLIARGEEPPGWQLLSSSAAARVAHGTWHAQPVFLKIFLPRGYLEGLKSLLRGSRGVRAVDLSEQLTQAGFHTPPVLAHGWLNNQCEFVLTRAVHAVPMLTYVTTRLGPPPLSLRERRQLLHECGREIARLHRNGWIHGDLRLANILVTVNAPQAPNEFWFLDNEGNRKCRSQRQRLRNLVQMSMIRDEFQSTTDRMRLLKGYSTGMALDPIEHRELANLIRKARQRRWARRERRGGPKARFDPRSGENRLP